MKKQTFATVTSASATDDQPSMLISTISLDRDRDVIVPEGAQLANYRKNPVVGWQHFRADPMPIGTTTSIEVEPGQGIRASWRWLEGDPLADRVRNAWAQGIVRAASVGFVPLEWSEIRETGGLRFTKWDLAEWSLVAVPSNPDAVRVLRSLDLWEARDVVLRLADEDARSLVSVCRAAIDAQMRQTPDAFAPYRFDVDAAARALATFIAGETIEIEDDDRVEEGIDEDVIRAAIAELPGQIRAGLGTLVSDAVQREIRRRLGRVD